MKKVILFTFLFLVLVCVFAYARIGLMVVGSPAAEVANPCPAYYADANVMFSWNGNHTSGSNYACDSAGNPVEGTNVGLGVDAGYGESGNGVTLLADDYITWANSGDTYINDDIGTAWFRVYLSAAPDNEVCYGEWRYDADNEMNVIQGASTSMAGWHQGGGGAADSASGHSVPTGSWANIGYTWDQSTGDNHASYGNSGTGWDPDEADGLDAFAANINEIVLGNRYYNSGDPGSGKYIYIDRFVIMSGYQTALPTNW